MNVLVTGGSGFLGSHLCERLLNEGNSVICLDNFYSGSLSNVSYLKDNENFTILNHDVENPIDLNVDVIFNLASPASPMKYQKDSLKTIKTNVMGALNCLELAKKNNAVIVQASTSEVYGDPLETPQKESYFGNVNPFGLRSCYDESKRLVETLFFNYHKDYNVDIRIARIFNTYGPKMLADDGRVVSNFIVNALRNKPLIINGTGKQTRSFCYVSDLIDGLINLSKIKDIKFPINLGNPYEISILDLAKLIIKMVNSKSTILFTHAVSDDPNRRLPDISMAKNYLDWEPSVTLDVGLENTIKYFTHEIARVVSGIR